MSDRSAYSAPLVFPGNSQPPVENGTLIIEDSQVVEITTQAVPDARHFEGCAIIPALINAHTHLEFSECRQPFPAGENFPEWIRSVISERNLGTESVTDRIRKGLEECDSYGTAAVGEICTHLKTDSKLTDADCYIDTSINVKCFREIIGFNSKIINERLEDAKAFVSEYQSHLSIGLSPHAPYSVHPKLFESLIQLAINKQLPVAFHLAETQEELELLDQQTGPFRKMLEQFGIWDDAAIPEGTRPIDYLEKMVGLKRGLVVHGNYLDQQELDLLKSHPHLFLVYCPRTHDHFGHSRYPLEQALEMGISMALGTDSRASNPDLNLWNEMLHIAANFPELNRQTLLDLGTIQGAKALEVEPSLGTLEAGKNARFCLVELGSKTSIGDPYQALFHADSCLLQFD